MLRRHLIAATGLLALGLSPAIAQNFGLPPTFGQVNLTAGFTPDPHTVNIVAGGPIDAGNAIGTDARGNFCVGTIADAPDYRVNYTSGSWPLIFNAMSSEDTTLVINAPDGQWYCDDDGAGYPNPRIEFSNPQSGQYDIWIGAYSGGNPDATLNVTELGGNTTPANPPPVTPPPATGGMPDFTLPPTYGQVTLTAGFTPDPHTISLTAGGNIDASAALGGSCRGDIATAPDYSLNYTSGSWPLIISAISDTDTTLVINGPDGQWYCDDDSGGNLNPEFTFDNPQSGRYDIWVGTYSGGTAPATLNISEIGGGNAGPVNPPPVTPPPATGGMPDFTLPPTYGQVTLTAGFTPDPHTISLTAGGNIDANAALGGSCRGDIATAPDYSLNYTSGSWPLIISATSSTDTTLVINGPDGQWYCDDDSGGSLNPLFEFANPQSGRYDIWVGTYSGGTAPATLNISEIGGGNAGPVNPPTTPPPATGGMPDFTLAPTYGQVTLNAGFTPDPHSINLTAGGDIDANAALGGSCRGDIATAPDYSLNYTSGSWPLIIWATAGADTTLVINGPDGQWYCDDDSAGSLNPLFEFANPQSGRYDIWVGTYSGGTAPATLFISELGP